MLRSMAFSYTRRSVVDVSKSQQNFSFLAKKVREFSSSSKRDANEHENASFNRVYTHPLSRVVLEHLQNVHGEWLVKNGLDRGLTINRDGSFCIQFPVNSNDYDGGRIWTSYDENKKKHWLSVYKQELLGRYPLHQGEGEWACQIEKCMMRTTVDRMVERIAEADRKSEGIASS